MSDIINLVIEPRFGDGAADHWWRGSSTTTHPQVGGLDDMGEPVPAGGMHARSPLSRSPHTSIGSLNAGDTVYVVVNYEVPKRGTPQALQVELVTDRSAAVGTESDPHVGVFPVGAAGENRTDSAILTVPSAGDYWLRIYYPASNTCAIFGVRASVGEADDLGVFTGDDEATEDFTFTWEGEPWESRSIARPVGAEPDPDPGDPGDPDPEEPLSVSGQSVADFLGQGDDADLVALADKHVRIVTALARSYTRGGGFTDAGPNDDIAAVITTATARLLANPEQIDQSIGEVSLRRGFVGWSLAEVVVLNGYRRRAT